MPNTEGSRETEEDANLLASRLAYHLRCLHKEATDPDVSSVERLAVVRDRVARIREIRRELAHA